MKSTTPFTVPSPRSASFTRAIAALAVLLAAAALPLPDAQGRIAHLPDICLFHRITGMPCPGCGMTRSLICLMHGRWAESWAYHPLGFAVATGLMGYAALQFARWRGARSIPTAPRRLQVALPYLGIALMLGVWAVRLSGWDPIPR